MPTPIMKPITLKKAPRTKAGSGSHTGVLPDSARIRVTTATPRPMPSAWPINPRTKPNHVKDIEDLLTHTGTQNLRNECDGFTPSLGYHQPAQAFPLELLLA